MDNDAWNRLSMVISAIWIVIILFRLAAYSTAVSVTPEGRFFRVTAAKVDKDGRCQYCYAKLSPEDTFCPQCGADVIRKGKD